MGRARAYLELARISNLPTCWSNVLVGAALSGALAWRPVMGAVVAVSLLYIAGMILNDVADAESDREDKPGRPIPSGRVGRGEARVLGWLCLAVGVVIASVFGVLAALFALLLAATIVGYDVLHKRRAWTVVLMGACRGLVYPLAGAMSGSIEVGPTMVFSIAVTAYTVGLTMGARREDRPRAKGPKWIAVCLPAIPLAAAVYVLPDAWWWAVLLGLVLAMWGATASRHATAVPPRIREAVLSWIAAFCLIDAYFLALIECAAWSPVAVALFAVTVLGHRKIMGT